MKNYNFMQPCSTELESSLAVIEKFFPVRKITKEELEKAMVENTEKIK